MSLEKDVAAVVESMGYLLYDASIVSESGQTIYRVSVISNEFEDGKRKGIGLDTFVELTHLISPILDVTPPVSGEYRLEVGSPGIERKLTKLEHYKNSLGENVKINSISKGKISGKLLDVNDSTIIVETEDGKEEFDFNDISKAKTYFEW